MNPTPAQRTLPCNQVIRHHCLSLDFQALLQSGRRPAVLPYSSCPTLLLATATRWPRPWAPARRRVRLVGVHRTLRSRCSSRGTTTTSTTMTTPRRRRLRRLCARAARLSMDAATVSWIWKPGGQGCCERSRWGRWRSSSNATARGSWGGVVWREELFSSRRGRGVTLVSSFGRRTSPFFNVRFLWLACWFASPVSLVSLDVFTHENKKIISYSLSSTDALHSTQKSDVFERVTMTKLTNKLLN